MNLAAAKNWRTVKLGDVGRVITGKTPSKDNPEDWGSVGVPFITPTDIADSSMFCKPQRHLSPAGAERFKNLIVPNRAICYTCIASVGKMCLASEPSLTNQQINSVIVDETKADHLFVFYLLRFLTPELMAIAGGTTTSIINKGQFENFEISIPESIDEQREIAGVLGCLDDKIELLRKENKTLESIAQTLFKEWFVDFRFPNATGRMIDSELGRIPEGWLVGKLGEVAEITSGKRPSEISEKQNIDFQYPLLGASSVMGYVNDFLFDQEVFVIGRVGTHGLIQRFSEKIWPSDNTLVLYSKYPEYLYQILRTINFELLNKGAVQPLITQGDMKAFEIFLPKEEVLFGFENIAEALSLKIKNNNSEIKTLSRLRDELLNKIFGV